MSHSQYADGISSVAKKLDAISSKCTRPYVNRVDMGSLFLKSLSRHFWHTTVILLIMQDNCLILWMVNYHTINMEESVKLFCVAKLAHNLRCIGSTLLFFIGRSVTNSQLI